jgi:hypothetical protein
LTELVVGEPLGISSPGVRLLWERVEQPDWFCLSVDGVEVVQRIDPVDAFVSGDAYSYDYWGLTPGTEHTLEVEAVINDGGPLKHSEANALAAITTDPNGIWLVDPDDSLFVYIAGQDEVEGGIGRSGTTYNPVGQRRPVRRDDALRGYEDTVSGVLFSATQRDAFLTLVGRQKPLRLVLSDLNIQVEVEDFGAPPTPIPGRNNFGCHFSFFQSEDDDENWPFDVKGG